MLNKIIESNVKWDNKKYVYHTNHWSPRRREEIGTENIQFKE